MGHFAVMEFIGTFFVTLAVSIVGEPLPVGLMLMAMVYIGGHISGAHYNPAVSVAFWMRGGLNNESLLAYVLAQISSACFAIWIAKSVTGNLLSLELPSDSLVGVPFLMEMLLVAVLCLVILTVYKLGQYKGSAVQGLIIGFTLTALMGIGLNPVILNPAIAVGATLMGLIDGGMSLSTNCILVHVVAPLIGGGVAAWLYDYLNSSKAK